MYFPFAKKYTDAFNSEDNIDAPYVPDYVNRPSWYMYSITVDENVRDALIDSLNKKSIDSRLSFPPVHIQPYYIDKFDDFEGTSEEFSASSLTCNCILEGIPILFTKEELLNFANASLDNKSGIIPKGTISEYWLACPLIIGKKNLQ